jgi:hypothetical protein
MTTCLESTGAAERPTFVKTHRTKLYTIRLSFLSSPDNKKYKGNQSSPFFFATTVYDIYVQQQFSYPRNKRRKGNQSIIQQRCRLARIRLETFYLQLEVPNLRVRIAQLGVEPIMIVLQSRRSSRSFAVLQTKNTINIIDF